MALRDYILCKNCKCKLIPDGSGLVREHLQIAKVEHIYRRGFEALASGEAG